MKYKNISSLIGVLVSSRIATLHDLSTVYGIKDAYDLFEVVAVDSFNIHKAVRNSHGG